jgi:hypothetical protein
MSRLSPWDGCISFQSDNQRNTRQEQWQDLNYTIIESQILNFQKNEIYARN